MAFNIKTLDFDTHLFGYKVGRIELHNFVKKDLGALKKQVENEAFRLVYIFTNDERSKSTLNAAGVTFVGETRVYINKDLKSHPTITNSIGLYEKCFVSPSLLKLAYASGAFSRFSNDPHFTGNESLKVFKTWIEKSVRKEIASHIVVYKAGSREVGLVTCNLIGDCCKIGLMAVHENFRNKNIARGLMQFLAGLMGGQGAKTITVTTQSKNTAACRLYESLGFNIQATESIFHLWI
ncbi:hypothetical protein MNBD_BACTEROID01-1652 [hydrothermal vent metagenome]|uniref:N-acetyltransferase domain-containing protein n=1 Tax=hydrothermal vent metagenome TaxID=652676 RepID=A0A3B0TWR6_9ZZZZ